MKWKPGDVLIEKGRERGSPRAVIVVECPEMFGPGSEVDLSSRVWGMYLEGNLWNGPWHGPADNKILHPDPDSVWAKWAQHCAETLAK